jgi:hypothetical protein
MPELIDMTQYPDRDEHEPYYIALEKMNAVIAESASPALAAENNRRTQLASLVEGAKETAAADLVSALFRHYKDEAAEYIQIGGSVLADAINAETDSTVQGYLDTVMSAEPGDTVRARILDRITPDIS